MNAGDFRTVGADHEGCSDVRGLGGDEEPFPSRHQNRVPQRDD